MSQRLVPPQIQGCPSENKNDLNPNTWDQEQLSLLDPLWPWIKCHLCALGGHFFEQVLSLFPYVRSKDSLKTRRRLVEAQKKKEKKSLKTFYKSQDVQTRESVGLFSAYLYRFLSDHSISDVPNEV